jgi:hypothetical protein
VFCVSQRKRRGGTGATGAVGVPAGCGETAALTASRVCRAVRTAAAVVLFAVLGSSALPAENSEIARLRAEQRTRFTDNEIYDGFFRTAFGAEMQFAGRTDRIRKYIGPVRVAVENHGEPDRVAQVAAIVADIRAHVANLDIAMVTDPASAHVVVRLVRNRDVARNIRAYFGDQAARIQHKLDPQCLSGYRKDESFRITHSDVILPVDAGDFTFYDCAYEEILQSLGPINDTPKIPWTMFNDDVHKGFFDIYDQYLLNVLYDLRVRPGMTKGEVRALLPQVLPTVRAFVAKTNGLPP